MNYVYIKPVEGVIIRNPDRGFSILPEGEYTAVNRKYGLARVAEGGAILKNEGVKNGIIQSNTNEFKDV